MNLIFASIAIFLLYIGSMVFMFGVPWSISNTYYLLEEKRKGLGWLFTVFCYGVGVFFVTRLAECDTGRLSVYLLSLCRRLGFRWYGGTIQRKPDKCSALYCGGYLLSVFSNMVFRGRLLVVVPAFFCLFFMCCRI